MGNFMSSCASDPSKTARIVTKSSINLCNKVKVVLPSGKVQEFQTPMLVAELMLENPLCLVCKPGSSRVARQASAMPADAKLELGQLYFLFPSNVFQSAKNQTHKSNAVPKIVLRPEKATETEQVITVQKQVKIPSVLKISEESSLFCGDRAAGFGNFHLKMAYERYKDSRNKLWKPKLQTIPERVAYVQKSGSNNRSTSTQPAN